MFAPLWIALFSCGTLVMLIGGDPKAWPFFGATLLGIGFLYHKFAKVRHVCLREDRFYISDLGRQYEVPVSQLQRVQGGGWINPETIVLHFKSDTGFGKRVDFVARWKFWSGFEEHPVVDELDRLIRRHRSDRSIGT